MATLTNTKIKDTYKSLLKVSDNGNLEAGLQEITDGEGNASGVQLNTGGDLTASGTVAFGSLKDSGEDITITKFVDEADGIASNDNDTTVPTSAAVKDYVDTKVTAEDLDFGGDSGTGSVDLDSQTFTISGTANEVVTSASGQTLTIGLPSSISVDVVGDLTGNVTATSVLADGVTATTQATSDNSTKVATTAFVKSVVTAEDLDFAGDTGTGAVDLDSQTFTIAGTANEIETSASGQTITIGLPSSVTVGTLNATTLAGTLSTAAQTNITSVGTLSSLAVSGDLTVDTSTLKVDSTNNRVGVGTSSPSAPLTIRASSVGFGTRLLGRSSDGFAFHSFRNSADDATNGEIGISDAQNMLFYTGASERLRIDSSGNVGIGQSTMIGTAAGRVALTMGGSTSAIINFGNAGTQWGGIYSASAVTQMFSTTGYLMFETASSERMRITSSGNVGIGTSSPASINAFTRNLTIAGSSASIVLDDTDASAFEIASSSNSLRIYNETSELWRITSSGNVGIGESNPAFPLHIKSSTDIVQFESTTNGLYNQYKSTEGIFGYVGSGSQTVSGGATTDFGIQSPLGSLIIATGGNTERMRIDASGNIIVADGGIIDFSLGTTSSTTIGMNSRAYMEIERNGLDGNIKFFTTTSGGGGLAERMRITSGGSVLVGTTSSTGSASNGNSIVGGKFQTVYGTVSGAVSGTNYTIFTSPNMLGVWIVTANVSAGTTSYSQTSLVNVNASAATTTALFNGSNIEILNSGLDVQVNQTSGANQNIQWSATRLA